jgi:hypothetical protein
LAIAAAAAGNIKGNGDQIAHVEVLDVTALLHNLARDLMSQHLADGRCRAASDHVLVAAADASRNHPQDHGMWSLFCHSHRASQVVGDLKLRVIDVLDRYL